MPHIHLKSVQLYCRDFVVSRLLVGMMLALRMAAVHAVQMKRPKAADIPNVDPAQAYRTASPDQHPIPNNLTLIRMGGRVPAHHMTAG